MITTPQALGEVLTQNSYDYVKPALLRYGLGRVLGVGLILAEGDEHKVSTLTLKPRCCSLILNGCPLGATQESHAGFCLSSYQGSLSCVLV